MTELEVYKKAYRNKDTKYIKELTKELAEQWLDAKIDAIEHINRIYFEQGYDLAWGDFNEEEGDFSNEISFCGFVSADIRKVHIYKGIEKLAKILGVGLSSYYNANGLNYYFIYKGREVFQIVKDKDI